MEINEVLELIESNLIKRYQKKSKFDFLQYFSLTDMTPDKLRKVAVVNKNYTLARLLDQYYNSNYWNLIELNLEQYLKCLHSIKEHELTKLEKIAVAQKLQEEGFPLLEGTMIDGARYYMERGIDAISKERIREDLIAANNTDYRKNAQNVQQTPKVLTKIR